jgi:hypothetical protein
MNNTKYQKSLEKRNKELEEIINKLEDENNELRDVIISWTHAKNETKQYFPNHYTVNGNYTTESIIQDDGQYTANSKDYIYKNSDFPNISSTFITKTLIDNCTSIDTELVPLKYDKDSDCG